MLEGYTTLGYLAGQTERIRLGMLVTGVMYRYPGVLAKTVTTLDVLSGGRATLGLGDAWYEREHTGLDVPYPALGERFERLEETFQICLRMWGDDNGAYRVSTTNSPKTSCVPSPIQRPRPPIIIGGGGERKTLRLVARYADIWSAPGGASPADIRRKIAVLADHYAAESRDRRGHPQDDPGFPGPARRHRRLSLRYGALRRTRRRPGDGVHPGTRPGGFRRAPWREGDPPPGADRRLTGRRPAGNVDTQPNSAVG